MTTMAEPEWDEQTRDLVVAYDAIHLCSSCGGPAFLCQDPALQHQWEVEKPVRCHRTTALREAQRPFTEKTNPVVEALIFRAVLKEPPRGR